MPVAGDTAPNFTGTPFSRLAPGQTFSQAATISPAVKLISNETTGVLTPRVPSRFGFMELPKGMPGKTALPS